MEPVADAFNGPLQTVMTTTTTVHSTDQAAAEHLFAGGGRMGDLLAGVNWAEMTLGPVERWPQSLRTSLRICLTSRHAIIIWWGPELTMFYNDAYIPTLGKRSPLPLGRPGREVWPEIWGIIGPMLEGVLATGQATWSDDQLLLLERNGYSEETYHTYSYSPIEDEAGGVGGVFTAVSETTQRVLAARRGHTARELATAVMDARSVEEVCAQAAQVIGDDPDDIPCALLYTLAADGSAATLANAVGLAAGLGAPSPSHIDLAHSPAAAPFALAEVAQTRQPTILRDIVWPAGALAVPSYLWPHTVMTLPVTEPGQAAPTAVLILGASPRREFDANYRAFVEQLVSHLATAFVAAHAYEAERAKAQAQTQALQETTRRMNEFLGVASHELRTPLTSISANIQIGERMTASLRNLPTDALGLRLERLNLLLNGAKRQAQRLDRLVGDLLDVSRINAGRLELRIEPCDLAPILAEVVEGQRLAWPGREITLTLPHRATLPLLADPDRIGQVVTNYLTNALKYSPVAQPVEVAAMVKGDQVRVTVRDHGPGIPPSEQAHLFDLFYRAPDIPQMSGSGVGLGLGLHICQNIVERHNGALGVISAPGEGATFWFALPLALPANTHRMPRE